MDKYDEEIAELTANPENIFEHWGEGTPLFAFASKSGDPEPFADAFDRQCGCLTQIRRSTDFKAETEELTAAIRADERIPNQPIDITVSDLPVFAEWQRRLDKELRNSQEPHEKA